MVLYGSYLYKILSSPHVAVKQSGVLLLQPLLVPEGGGSGEQ